MVRRAVPLLLLTALLAAAVLPGSAAAQPPPPGAAGPVLEDPTGDVEVQLAGAQSAPEGSGTYACADLVRLDMAETRHEFTFTVELADLKDGQQEAPDGCRQDVLFVHNAREFRLSLYRSLPVLFGVPFGALDYRDDPAAPYSSLWSSGTEVRMDLAADTLAVTLPRDLLADADGAAPFPGRALEAMRASAYSTYGGGNLDLVPFLGLGPTPFPAYATDRMPADPSQWATYAIREGLQQTGHARLFSAMPFRASNGEATTFVYNVTAANLGDADDVVELAATGVPAGLAVTLPIPLVSVPAGGNRSIPVLVALPFSHQHGDSASFVLESRSSSDPGSVGRIELGVRFLAIPQPAGHHDTVYFHSAPAVGAIGPVFAQPDGYVNTLEEDPTAVGGNLYSSGFSGSGTSFTSSWILPLSPALAMGIDVDPARTGLLRVPIGTTAPVVGATMSAVLQHAPFSPFGGSYPDFQKIAELAVAGPTEPVDLPPNGGALLEAVLQPGPDAGRYPFEPGHNLWIEVSITYSGAPTLGLASESLHIAPGGSAQLPLREWHDDVDDALSLSGGPALSALGPQERRVNPGEAVVFPVSVANALDHPVTLRFEVSGPNAAWAELPQSAITAPAHGTANAALVVRAPGSATHGERADLVLHAFAAQHPEERGLLRLVAVADTVEDLPDDTAVAEGLAKKESPAGGPAVLGLALAVALLAVAKRGGGRGRHQTT